jgi:hypothetical protein
MANRSDVLFVTGDFLPVRLGDFVWVLDSSKKRVRREVTGTRDGLAQVAPRLEVADIDCYSTEEAQRRGAGTAEVGGHRAGEDEEPEHAWMHWFPRFPKPGESIRLERVSAGETTEGTAVWDGKTLTEVTITLYSDERAAIAKEMRRGPRPGARLPWRPRR